MIQDMHSHTYYSLCGRDKPEIVIEKAIADGIEVLGICDHNYGIAQVREERWYQRAIDRYLDHMRLLQEKYKRDIHLLCGIEVCTLDEPGLSLPDGVDISGFDYCLVENLDHVEHSVIHGDVFEFAKRAKCKTGIAHTDLFSFMELAGVSPECYFAKMAEAGIFWEININYDSIHQYREHEYVSKFFDKPMQQELVRQSGVEVSIGFDGHRIEDYLPERIKYYCNQVEELRLNMVNI